MKKFIKIIFIILILVTLLKIALPTQINHYSEKAKIIDMYTSFPKYTEYCIVVETLDNHKIFEFPTTKQNYDKYNKNKIINIYQFYLTMVNLMEM